MFALRRAASAMLPAAARAVAAPQGCFMPMFITNGQVKWFDVKKGFGFVVPGDGSPDVFVHQTQVHADGFRSLAQGEDVEFEIEEDESGRRRALKVTGPDGAFVQGAAQRRPPFPGFPDDDDMYSPNR